MGEGGHGGRTSTQVARYVGRRWQQQSRGQRQTGGARDPATCKAQVGVTGLTPRLLAYTGNTGDGGVTTGKEEKCDRVQGAGVHVKRRQCRVAAGPGKRGRFAAVGVGFGAVTRTRLSLPRGDAQRQRESPPSKDRCWRDTHWAAQRAGDRTSER
jgi:hypothetical protein